MDLSFLPSVNASLNALASVLLIVGRRLAKQHRIAAHQRVMASAFATSTLFLVLYVTHKAWRSFEHTPFHAEGAALLAYRALLLSHVALAMLVPVLAVTLIGLGLRGRIARHRRLARVAWPIWMYVSLTGVAIYLLLYHFNPPVG